MHSYRIDHPQFSSQLACTVLAREFRRTSFVILAGFCLVAAQNAHAQEAVATPVTNGAAPAAASPEERVPVDFESSSADLSDPEAMAATPMNGQSVSQTGPPTKQPVESEIIVEGLVSYGNYRIFASGFGERLFVGGVEYDRHSWGRFLGADVDYVAEVLPFVLLDKPIHVDIYGNPDPLKEESERQYVPGFGFSPIGFRMQWMSKRRFKPYLEAKGGVIAFDKKVPSTEASYINFSLQSCTGLQVKMSERWGLRLGLFSDFHFSNAFIVPINPGLDVMSANVGISYHLGRKNR